MRTSFNNHLSILRRQRRIAQARH